MSPNTPKHLIMALLSLTLLLSACMPLPAAEPAATATPAPVDVPATPHAAVARAQARLAEQLGRAADTVLFISAEPVDWPDACLGLPAADEACGQVVTPGYRIVLEADGERYTVHADAEGREARVAQAQAGAAPAEVVAAARRVLAEQTGAEANAIEVVSVEAATWRDGCLELARPDEMCTMALVPGYRVTLEVGGQQYVVHTDRSGNQARSANTQVPTKRPPAAALRARIVLANRLGVSPSNVRIVLSEAVDWPDSCIGAAEPGEMCAQVITPGYRIVLEVNGVQYAYHTDTTATVMRTPAAPAAGPESLAPETQAAIYSAVIRELYTVDHTFNAPPEFPVLYLAGATDDRVGGGDEPPQASQPIPAAVRQEIEARLTGGGGQALPARIVWVESQEAAPRDAQGGIAEGGAVIILGNIRPQFDDSVRVAASIYVAMLAAGGQTYVLQEKAGIWQVTGKTGMVWIS